MMSRDFLSKVPTLDETAPYLPFCTISCISSQHVKEGIFSKDDVSVTFFLGVALQSHSLLYARIVYLCRLISCCQVKLVVFNNVLETIIKTIML